MGYRTCKGCGRKTTQWIYMDSNRAVRRYFNITKGAAVLCTGCHEDYKLHSRANMAFTGNTCSNHGRIGRINDYPTIKQVSASIRRKKRVEP